MGENLIKNPQLTLSVQLPDDETFTNYVNDLNVAVVEQLKRFIKAPITTEKEVYSFYLFGIEGVGKSHLLHACCAFAQELSLSSLCLSLSEIKDLSVEVLEGLEHIDVICLDNIQCVAGEEKWQQGIFDLYNRVTEHNKKLIITGNESVNDLTLSLPDLRSRLSWGLIEQVKPLSDQEKLIAIQLRAQKRGLTIVDDVAKYLLTHHSRNMKDLLAVLDALDNASMREQRKITIPFIKDVLFNRES